MFHGLVLLNCSVFLDRAAGEALTVSTHHRPVTYLSGDVQGLSTAGTASGAGVRASGKGTTWHPPSIGVSRQEYWSGVPLAVNKAQILKLE